MAKRYAIIFSKGEYDDADYALCTIVDDEGTANRIAKRLNKLEDEVCYHVEEHDTNDFCYVLSEDSEVWWSVRRQYSFIGTKVVPEQDVFTAQYHIFTHIMSNINTDFCYVMAATEEQAIERGREILNKRLLDS